MQQPDATTSVVLPPAVRARVVALAADRLGLLRPDLVPVALRAVARFVPAKRARLGAPALAAALESDPGFRQEVAEGVRTVLPELAAAVLEGAAPPAAPPEDLAAAAYLLRPPGWSEYVAAAAAELADRESRAQGTATSDVVRRLTEQLEAVRAAGRQELAAARQQLRTGEQELLALRRRVRELGDRVGRAEAAQRSAVQAAAVADAAVARAAAGRDDELQALQARADAAENALAASRSATRDSRHGDELRLRLLLDAVVGAAQGLRRELALPPALTRPADALAADYPAPGLREPERQGRADDDPALLDALLGVPTTHLLVDGYNVTKTGYGSLALEVQRHRLLRGLGALAARCGAEVTVVFDGVERTAPLAVPAPRGVRLLFSRAGETADEVLGRLVRHEPAGRPVVVVSSDREVADVARSHGARPVASRALVRLLDH